MSETKTKNGPLGQLLVRQTHPGTGGLVAVVSVSRLYSTYNAIQWDTEL